MRTDTPPPAPARNGAVRCAATPAPHRSRRWRHVLRRPWLLLGVLAVLLAACFVLVDLYQNRGHYIPPLDDTYIHAQYATQLAHGHFLQYATGAAPSTGASSFLYMLLLGGIATVGLSGPMLLPTAVALGVAFHGVTTACSTRLGTYLLGARCGGWAGLITAVSGPLLWAAGSGMEIMLTAALVLGTVLSFAVELPRARFVRTPLLGALAALCRPDAMLFVAVVCVGMLTVRRPHAPRRPLRTVCRGCWLVLPIVAGAAQLALYAAITGSATTDGVAAKSLLHPPQFDPFGFLAGWGANVNAFLRALTGLDGNHFLLPGGLILAALGVVALLRGSRAHSRVGWVLAGGLLVVLAALATLSTATWQHLRYIQPYLPVLVLLLVIGVTGLVRRAARPHAASLVRLAVLGVATVYTVAAVPAWANILGRDSAHTRERVVSLAVWMREHLPAGARVGVHDAGAAGYLSGHPTVDLVGLTTAGMARAGVNGPGSVYEALRDMPPSQRPNYLAIYDNLPQGLNLIHLADASLFNRTDPVVGIPELSVYGLNWSLAGSGALPHRAVAGTLRDQVNVGSLNSEDQHHYTFVPASPGRQAPSEVRTVSYPQRRMVDSARHIVGGEHFTLSHLTPGHDVQLVLRHDSTGTKPGVPTASRQVTVRVDGVRVTDQHLQPDPRGWHESTVTLPGALIHSPNVTVSIEPTNPRTGPYPDYRSFHYWAYQ